MEANRKVMGENIQFYMDRNGIDRATLAKVIGVPYSSVTCWINGKTYPRIDRIEKMANYFGINKSDLVEPMGSAKEIKALRIPVYGRVAAGIPIEAIENIVDYEEIPGTWTGEYGALKVKGDSMEPRIMEGDTLIVRRQDTAESGDIVVALVNGQDATVKKLIKRPDSIILQPSNPKYEPLVFTRDETREIPVTIWGKVVENRQKF